LIKKNFFLIKKFLTSFFFFAFFLNQKECLADWAHHQSFLLGSKAAGMGGAYTALSDDPSGIYYNPAGMAFSDKNELSLNTTNYYKTITHQESFDSLTNSSFNLTDSQIYSGFFGGLLKINFFKNLFVGFALYTKDNVNIDSTIHSMSNDGVVKIKNNQKLVSYQDYYSGALSFKVTEKLGLGVSCSLFNIEYTELQNAIIKSGPHNNPDTPPPNKIYVYETWMYDSSFSVQGIQVGLGVLMKMSKKISLGFSGTSKFILAQRGSSNLNDNTIVTDTDFVPIGNNSFVSDQHVNVDTTTTYTKPFQSLPMMLRAGIGFFPSKKQTWSFDLIYHSGADAADPFYRLYPVLNAAAGSNFKFFKHFKARFGLFTNFWAGDPTVKDQFVNIHFIGLSSGITYESEKKVTYGFIYQEQKTLPGGYYSLEDYYDGQGNNPKVNSMTQQFAFYVTGEI
jgi:long-chain fatty acid transport protein